jgi:hypothetical protein
VVDPYAVFAAEGEWYLTAWCHVAEAERRFRIDRIRGLATLHQTFDPPAATPRPAAFDAPPDDPEDVSDEDVRLDRLRLVVEEARFEGARPILGPRVRGERDGAEAGERAQRAAAELAAVLARQADVADQEVDRAVVHSRLADDPTEERREDDLRVALEWLTEGRGAGLEDLLLPGTLPVREISRAICSLLGWLD